MAVNRQWLTDSLRRSLEALALPGREALDRMPPETVRADELALEFDNFYSAYRGNFGADLSPVQLEALARVDRLLSQMSGSENSELWKEQAVITHPRWAEVRQAAQTAMESLGWSLS